MRRTFALLSSTTVILLLAGGLVLAQTAPQGTLDANCPGPVDGGNVMIDNPNGLVAQTFVARSTGALTGVQVEIQRFASGSDAGTGVYTLQIAAVDASGAPGVVLASTEIPAAGRPDSALATLTANFGDPAPVSVGRRYALIVKKPASAAFGIGMRLNDPSCPDGNVYLGSTNTDGSNGSFRPWSTDDLVYVTYVTPDTVAPDTRIAVDRGLYQRKTSVKIGFYSSETGSTFRCALDGAAYRACVSPKGYTGLRDGRHTFLVRAADRLGNMDSTPARMTWMVDTAAPRGALLINGGAASTRSRTVRLALKATDPAPASGVASVRLRNAGGAWSAWGPYATGTKWTLGAGAGTKTVHAQYRDRAGNLSLVTKDAILYKP